MDNLASKIYELFMQRYKIVLGKAAADIHYDDYRSDWEQAAKLCQELNASPEDFIRAQFDELKPYELATLSPVMLHHPRRHVIYKYQKLFGNIEKVDYNKFFMVLDIELKKIKTLTKKSELEILSDECYNFPGWFRLVKFPESEKIKKYYFNSFESLYIQDASFNSYIRNHSDKKVAQLGRQIDA